MVVLRESSRGHLAMLAFSLCIAGSFSLGSLVANEIDPIALTTVRFGIATLFVGAFSLFGGQLRLKHAAAPWRYFISGALMAVYFVLMFEGLKTASAVSTSAVFTLTPLISAIFGWFLLRQITTLRMWVALGVGAIGAVWVIFRADLQALFAFNIGVGESIFFVGCIAHAMYTPVLRKLNRGEPPIAFVLGTVFAGCIILSIYGWKTVWQTDWKSLPSIVWITLAYLTFFATWLSFLAVNYAALRLPAAKVMAYTYLTPTWVILWEGALGRGLPGPMILAGVAATAMALLLLLKQEETD